MTTLLEVRRRIQESMERMDRLFGESVFDEWVVMALHKERVSILDYSGPRRESFSQSLSADLDLLRSSLAGGDHHVGDFDFASFGQGTCFDGFMVLGEGVFLLCNNTRRTMRQISHTESWRKAQVVFVELSEWVRSHPLEQSTL